MNLNVYGIVILISIYYTNLRIIFILFGKFEINDVYIFLIQIKESILELSNKNIKICFEYF